MQSLSLKVILPFTYTLHTRLKKIPLIFYHAYYEWIPAIYFIWLYNDESLNLGFSIFRFSLYYIAFISIYEIGYIINDLISVKYETNPRYRLGNPNNLKKYEIPLWISIRIISWVFITYYLDLQNNYKWLIFYIILISTFILHNVLKNNSYKISTFINLALLRFLAPFFIIITQDKWPEIIYCTLLFYVFHRTLGYMDSKNLLLIPERTSKKFKQLFNIILLPSSVIISILLESDLPIIANIYYLSIWFFYNK